VRLKTKNKKQKKTFGIQWEEAASTSFLAKKSRRKRLGHALAIR
jgi:hypothetical protein